MMEAYERLKSWKRPGNDSFSAVVKRVATHAGTMESMARFVVERAASAGGDDALLQSTIESRQSAKHDPRT
jgi:predicted CopG family antitoxin